MSNNEEDGSTEAGAQGDATGVTGSVDPRTARRSFLGTVGSGLALAGPLGTVLGTASSHPTANFAYDPSRPVVDEEVTLDGTRSYDEDGTIERYYWEVERESGGFDSYYVAQTTHHWQEKGQYEVSLEVTDNGEVTDTATETVYVGQFPPEASFTYSPSPFQTGTRVTFDASGSSDLDGEVVDYEWTFETVDGSPSAAGERVEHTFETAGEHTVRLEVEDDNGAGDSSTKTVSVAEGATPSPSPTPSPTEKETPTERGTPTSRPIDSSPTPTPSSSQPDGTTETPTSRVPTATPRRSTTDSPTEAAGANGSSDDGGDSLSTILGGIGAVIAGAAGLYGVARFRRGGDDGPTAGGSGGGTTSPNGGHGGSSPSSKRAANGGSTSQSSGAAAVSSPPDPDPSSPLVDVSGVRPTDAAKLTNAGYESTDDLKRADESDLASVVGSALAARIVADVGRIDPGEADNSGEQSGGLAQEARQALMAVDGVESDDASDLLAAGYESRSDLREARQTELSAVVGNVLASRVKDDVGYPGDGNEPDSGDSDSTDDSGPNSDSTGQPETSQSAPSGGADDVDVLQGLDGVDAATKRALAEAGYTSIEDLRTASTTALSKVVGHDTAVRVRDEVGFVRTGDVSADGTTQEQPETGSDRSSATDSTAESGSDPDTGGGTAAGVVAGAGAATDGRDTEDASEGEDESKGEGERRANEERLAALYDAADSRIDAAEEDPFAEPAATRDRLVRAHAEVVSLAEAASEYGDEELLSIARNALETVEARLEAFPALSGSIATARDRVPPDEGPSTTTSDSSLEAAREEYDTAIETATDVGFDTERLERERRAILDELDRREPPEEPTDSENADESGSTDSSDDEPATSDPAGSDDGPSVDGPTTDELVAELQRLDEETEGYPLTTEMRASGAFDPGNYYDAFDSWADALEAAGIDKKQRLVDDIRRVADVIDGVPNTTDMNEHGVHSSGTYSKAFGSWDDALAAAELNDRNALAADDSDGSGTPKSERTGSTTETGTEAETDPSTTETDSGSSTVATETEFATIGDITEDRRLDRPIAVKVTEVTADPGDRKQASLSVTDLAGGSCRFNVWAKHGVDVEWEPDQWYVLRQARGKSWTRSDGTTQRQLSSTKDLTVRRVGSDPPDGETKDQTGSASDADGDVADEEIGSEDRTASRSDVREESPSDDGDDGPSDDGDDGPSDDGDDGPSDGGDDGPSDDGILGEVFSEFDEMEDDE